MSQTILEIIKKAIPLKIVSISGEDLVKENTQK